MWKLRLTPRCPAGGLVASLIEGLKGLDFFSTICNNSIVISNSAYYINRKVKGDV